jgi:RNA polymerase sigma factor (TIGR02999 family)
MEPDSAQLHDVTALLVAWSIGDEQARDQLLPLVYDELREIAHRYLSRERRDHTLQTTALVHEAYLRLIDQRAVQWQNRAHFFGVAAQLMRRILIDYARSHQTAKRGQGAIKLSLDEMNGRAVLSRRPPSNSLRVCCRAPLRSRAGVSALTG